MSYHIYGVSWNLVADSDYNFDEFQTSSSAISYALKALPSDDIPYIVADENASYGECIVFEGRVWYPQNNLDA